ncbi:MAG TPA: ABC transporter ATP-binding protein [Gemmatimonadales bacterium]|jgi:ABC-type Fe3+/spermidine/putrescine transport system ATPase subunit
MSEAYLRLEGLTKEFPGRRAVDDLSLEVARGEILALLGPSGCGKTTTLRLLAGFETPDAGRVAVDGDDVTHLPPARRRFGMVFQNYALFPHLDVGENVGFGLPNGRAAAPPRARIAEVLAMVDLAGYERRPVTALSGGQQQRVALARSLAPEPRVLLLDEPLSNLDPSLRERTRKELREAIQRVGITTVFVTHEQEEAFDLGDRIAVMNAGRLEQVGTADELYDQPKSPFVATFVGRSNVLPGEIAGGARGTHAYVRPEAIQFSPTGPLEGKVTARRFAGGLAYFTVALGADVVVEVHAHHGAAKVGETVRMVIEKVLLQDGQTGKRADGQ